jgi:hypothetical protein
MIPLSIAVGALADRSGWLDSSASLIVSFVLFLVQLAMLVSPVVRPNTQAVDLGFKNAALPWRTMSRFDQWDWRPVRDIADGCGVAVPEISFLGSGRTFDPPQIEYPWVVLAASKQKPMAYVPNAVWLWRYEDGPLDWQKVMDGAEKSDIVITAPRYVGEVENKEDLDNQYNAAFEERLSQDPLFQAPVHLEMGRFESVDVVVFAKRNLACHLGQQAAVHP